MPTKPGQQPDPAAAAPDIYDTLEDSLGAKLRSIALEVRGANKGLTERTLEIGARLKTVQMLLQDRLGVDSGAESKFLEWVSKELPFRRSTAYNYMYVADRFATYPGFTDLSFDQSAVFLMSAPQCPEGAYKQLLTEAERGLHITFQYAQQVVAAHKPPKEPPAVPPMPAGQFNMFWATPWATGIRPADRKAAVGAVIPSTNNSTLYLWVPPVNLLEGLELMDAWGFTYKTSFAACDQVTDESPATLHVLQCHTIGLVGTKGRGAPRATVTEMDAPGKPSWDEDGVDGYAQDMLGTHPNGKVLQLYNNLPVPTIEGWSLWNHRSGQVESESATVPVAANAEVEQPTQGEVATALIASVGLTEGENGATENAQEAGQTPEGTGAGEAEATQGGRPAELEGTDGTDSADQKPEAEQDGPPDL